MLFCRAHQGLQDALFGFEFGVSEDVKSGFFVRKHRKAMKTSQVKCAYFFEIVLNHSENSSIERVLVALSTGSLRISKISDHVWKVF